MKISDLAAKEIIVSVLGERGVLKGEEELAVILKKRLTKKEMYALNAKATNADIGATLLKLNIDLQRYEELISAGTKKIKNESVHREFYDGGKSE